MCARKRLRQTPTPRVDPAQIPRLEEMKPCESSQDAIPPLTWACPASAPPSADPAAADGASPSIEGLAHTVYPPLPSARVQRHQGASVTLLIGLFGAVLGTLFGAIATYLTTRSNMRLTLEHSYDQTLRDKRLERYQALFHTAKCLPRYWLPRERPTRKDLQQFRQDFHDWYFGEEAGGMFLTPAAKNIYTRLLNLLVEAAYESDEPDSALSDAESQRLRELASDLRHQLAEDVGAANPPRLRWTRLGPAVPPPPGISS